MTGPERIGETSGVDLSALGVFSALGDITSALKDIIMSVGVSLGGCSMHWEIP